MKFMDWAVLIGPWAFAIFMVLVLVFVQLTFIRDALGDIARAIREKK